MILFGMELLGVAQGCGSGEARVGLCLLRLGFYWKPMFCIPKYLNSSGIVSSNVVQFLGLFTIILGLLLS